MKKRITNRFLSVVLCICIVLSLLPAVALVKTEAAAQPSYISSLYFASDSSKSDAQNQVRNAGYTLIDYDLNKGAAGKYIYMGYKTTTYTSEAITGIFFSDDVRSPSGSYTFPYNGYNITANKVSDVDLNEGCGVASDYIYAYTTKDRNFGNPITEIKFKGNNTIDSGWNIGRQIASGSLFGTDGRNLNAGTIGGDKIYLHYKQFSATVSTTFYYLNADGTRNTAFYSMEVGDHAETLYKVPSCPTSVTYDGRTFTFKGWRWDTETSNASVSAPCATYITGDQVFYAVYIADLTLSFDANGGTGAPAAQTQTYQYINAGSSSAVVQSKNFTIPTAKPTYDGKCSFLGWSTDRNATKAAYQPGQTVTLKSNTLLYAIWKDHDGVSSYRDNGTSHTFSWSCCGPAYTEDHSYQDGVCVCGDMMDGSVAKVTKKGVTTGAYPTLEAAFKAVENAVAEDEVVLWLLQDLEFTTTQKYSCGVYTLDLNGHTLKNTNNGCVLNYSKVGGNLTINDSVGTGKVIGNNAVYAPFTTLTINGGTFEGTAYGVCSQDATVVINGGTFSAPNPFHPVKCNVTINNGTFNGTDYAADIYESTFTINGGTFTSDEYGLYCTYSADGIINGGTFSGSECAVLFGSYHNILTVNGGCFIADQYDFRASVINQEQSIVFALGKNGEGATFPGGLTVYNFDLSKAIVSGAGYWQGTKMTVLTEGLTSITGEDVVIKTACTHNYVDFVCDCGAVSSDAEAGVTINGTTSYYASFTEAIDKVLNCTAQDNASVTLRRDVTLSETLNISSGVFELNLGGKKLSASGGDAVICVSNAADLTVTNGTVNGLKYGICVKDGAALTVNATVDGSSYGLYVTDGEATVSGGTVSGGGRAIQANNSTLTVSGGTVSGTDYANGIYAENCTLTVTKGSIISRYSNALNIVNCTMTMSGGTINGYYDGIRATGSNVTVTYGSIYGKTAVFARDNSTVTLYSGYVNGDTTEIEVKDDSKVTLNISRTETPLRFYQEINVSGTTLKQLLGEGAAYWINDLQLTPEDTTTKFNVKSYTGTNGYVSIKAQCSHTDGTKSYEISDMKHIATFSCCGAYVYEYHSYDGCFCACGAHAPVESGDCPDCDTMLMQIRMYDAGGDGWATNRISVYEDGVLKTSVYVPEGDSFTWTDIMDPEMEYRFVWSRDRSADQCSFEILLGTEVIATATAEECGKYMDGEWIYPVCSHANASYTVTADGHELSCSDCGVKGEQEHSYDHCVCACGAEQHTTGENGLCTLCGKLTVTIHMSDSFGDGWNGNEIWIYLDGKRVYRVDFEDGDTAVWNGSLEFCANYEFKWREGDLADECSYQIVIGGETVVSATGEVCSEYQNKQVFYTTVYHLWTEATCTEPKNCSSCGTTEGEALGHTPNEDDGNCTTAVTCSVCGGVATEAMKHNFVAGECDNPGCKAWETFNMTYYVDGKKVHSETYTAGSAYYPWTEVELDNGMVLKGWATEKDGEVVYYVNDYCWPEDDMEFYAVYGKVNTVTCFYYDSEAKEYWENGSEQVFDGDSITPDAQYSYWFKCIGWATQPGGEMVYAVGEQITPAGDLELYTVAVPFQVTIDLGAEDATYLDENGDPITVLSGTMPYSLLYLTNFPTRLGYVFLGFDYYEIQTDEETGVRYIEIPMTEDITVTAQWELCSHAWTEATCTEPKTCSVCKVTEGNALGHEEPVYVNNGANHSKVSPCCSQVVIAYENHSYVDGQCICGSRQTLLNGIVAECGSLFYYRNGNRYYAGLIEIEGDIYYVRSNGELVIGRTYWTTKHNGLRKADSYYFDENGKLCEKNGLVEENGGLYYYVDGKLNYAGLIEIDGAYYYIRTNGQAVTGQTYWITKTNDLKPAASYEFDAEGKLVERGTLVKEADGIYYYVDGKRTYGGLILVDGKYYYVRSNGQLVTDRSYWITKTNDLLPAAKYSFDADGVMTDI